MPLHRLHLRRLPACSLAIFRMACISSIKWACAPIVAWPQMWSDRNVPVPNGEGSKKTGPPVGCGPAITAAATVTNVLLLSLVPRRRRR